MQLRNCARCGALFGAPGGKAVCPRCAKEEQEEFEAVRAYLKENPKSPLLEVSRATGVSVARLREYVRQGRLELSEPGDAGLTCARCGAPLTTGRLCERCSRTLARELRAAGAADKRDPGGSKPAKPAAGKSRVHLADRFRRDD